MIFPWHYKLEKIFLITLKEEYILEMFDEEKESSIRKKKKNIYV